MGAVVQRPDGMDRFRSGPEKKVPAMYPADALLFLAGAPMIAGLLLRPHQQPSERSSRLGLLDFFLLLLWWLYLYISFVVCWQYVSPNEDVYNRNFDCSAGAECILLAASWCSSGGETSGRWKKFYGSFAGAVVFNGIGFYVLNRAIEKDVYFTGSWYDIPYSASFALFTAVGAAGTGIDAGAREPGRGILQLVDGESGHDGGALAADHRALRPARSSLPEPASHFRVLVTLATMFLMAFLLFMQHRRLNRELRRTNVVLQEASLTDPLTGLRNRRYFSATIEADVSQALRSHADDHDPHTRDLVFYLIDADNFKEVNDRYGHDVGDSVLVEMARRLSSSIRHSDVLVRWGGEEFLIVSRYTDRSEAELLAQRVLSAVADTPFTLGISDRDDVPHLFAGLGGISVVSGQSSRRHLRGSAHARRSRASSGQAVGQESRGRHAAGRGKIPATTVERLHSTGLQVDVLAVAGPGSED